MKPKITVEGARAPLGRVEYIECRIAFVVEGRPVPTARARVQHGAGQNERRTVEYKASIARAARALVQAGWVAPKAAARVSIVLSGMTRGDLDNVAKGVLDGLVLGGILADDSFRHVAELRVSHEGGLPRTMVEVEVLPGGRR